MRDIRENVRAASSQTEQNNSEQVFIRTTEATNHDEAGKENHENHTATKVKQANPAKRKRPPIATATTSNQTTFDQPNKKKARLFLSRHYPLNEDLISAADQKLTENNSALFAGNTAQQDSPLDILIATMNSSR